MASTTKSSSPTFLPLSTTTPSTSNPPSPETELEAPDDPLAGIPPLTTTILTSPTDQIAALKLVADSIAQMRQTASRSIIYHPLFILAWGLMAAVTAQLLWKPRGDFGLWLVTLAGLTMALLVGVRGVCSGYLKAAEDINLSFLTKGRSEGAEDDLILGTRFGDEIIGSLVLRLETPSSNNASSSSPSKKKNNHKIPANGKGTTALIRAWAVRLRFRHKGVGIGLLEEAVRITRERLGKEAEIGFAADHANSVMVLPGMFNGAFVREQKRAVGILDGILGSVEGTAGEKKGRRK